MLVKQIKVSEVQCGQSEMIFSSIPTVCLWNELKKERIKNIKLKKESERSTRNTPITVHCVVNLCTVRKSFSSFRTATYARGLENLTCNPKKTLPIPFHISFDENKTYSTVGGEVFSTEISLHTCTSCNK